MSNAGKDMNKPEPPPVPNATTPVWELVVRDMLARDHAGRAKYGTPLQAGNGRNALVDAYQEALDLCVYLRQEMAERDRLETENARLREALQPFAEYARLMGGFRPPHPDDTAIEDEWGGSRGIPAPQLGDCRRAKAALEGKDNA